jgi:hypothetical protein
MKPRTKILTYYGFNYTGLILLILNGVLISTGTPVEKAFPLSIIGCVLVVISIFFLPKKRDYEALKQQKEQEKKENNYQK